MRDLFIFGDITRNMEHFEDTSAGSFIYDLSNFNGEDITVHLNSAGGDVFAAIAIYNSLKNYSGNVTVSIEGLAASAASVVAMGGKKICMASNALIMLHLPAVALEGYFDNTDLNKLQTQLAAVEQSLIKIYSTRIPESKARELMAAETWLNAEEALDLGLIDEITGEVPLAIDDKHKFLFVNKLAISTKNFDTAKIHRALEAKTVTQQEIIAQVRTQELTRIRNLQALKCDNAAVNAIVDVALSDGQSAAQIQAYIDAVKKIPVQNATDKIAAVIRDQMTSGAENVNGQPEMTAEDIRKAQADRIVAFANGTV